MEKNLRTKETGFLRWRTGLIHRQTGLIRTQIKTSPLTVYASPSVLIFVCPLVLLICLYLHVFAYLKKDSNTIVMSVNCMFFQDKHSEMGNYPFKHHIKYLEFDRIYISLSWYFVPPQLYFVLQSLSLLCSRCWDRQSRTGQEIAAVILWKPDLKNFTTHTIQDGVKLSGFG